LINTSTKEQLATANISLSLLAAASSKVGKTLQTIFYSSKLTLLFWQCIEFLLAQLFFSSFV